MKLGRHTQKKKRSLTPKSSWSIAPKKDSHRICIMAGGNLIQYKGDLTMQTADLTTSKLLWNSVLGTCNSKYMCLDIKHIYLPTALDYFEYMQMPLAVFPEWIKQQYELDKHAHKGQVFTPGAHSLGSPTGWNTSKQTPPETACPPWLLQVQQHTGIVET